MSNFVLIITIVQFYGPAMISVPFATAEACLDARDHQRGGMKSAECYATGAGSIAGHFTDNSKRGKINR